MLVFDSIIFSYETKSILRGVYLSLSPGSVTGLFGFNGAGKSTLIKIGSGFLQQTDGNVFIDEKVVLERYGTERFGQIGYLSQDSFIPKDLTVETFIHYSSYMKDLFSSDDLIKSLMK